MKHTKSAHSRLGLVLLVLLALLLTGCNRSAVINGVTYAPDTTTLDLSGSPVDDPAALTKLTKLTYLDIRNTGISNEMYDVLAAALPECEILWTPLFQGQSYDIATTSLTVSTLTEQDLQDLARFPSLTHVDATGVGDMDMISQLVTRYPDLQVDYTLYLGGVQVSWDATQAELTDVAYADLAGALALLPQLQEVRLLGQLPEAAQLLELQKSYPNVTILWQVEIYGVAAENTLTELDISGIALTDTQELESKLAYLPNLEKVLMMDCGISNEEMEALNLRHDDVLFVWTVTLGKNIVVRTDITAFCLHNYGGHRRYKDEDYVNMRYLTELVCLDLGHQDITHCEFVAYMPHLKYLILADTKITDLTPLSGLKELVFLEIFMTKVTDYTPLLSVTSLEDLNIGWTKGDPEVVKQMVWLDRLWWSYRGYGLTKEEADAVEAALPDTIVEFYYESSTGGDWRKSPNYYAMRDCLGLSYMTG